MVKKMNLVKILSLLGLSKKEAVLRLRNNQIRINGEIHNLNDFLKVEDRYMELGEFIYFHLINLPESQTILNYFKGDIPSLFQPESISCSNTHIFFEFKNFIKSYICISISKNKHFVLKLLD